MNQESSEYAPDRLEKGQLLEILREKGIHGVASRQLVDRWIRQREAEVDAENTLEVRVRFNAERSELFLAAGDREGAIHTLNEAWGEANQIQDEAVREQLCEELLEVLARLEDLAEGNS